MTAGGTGVDAGPADGPAQNSDAGLEPGASSPPMGRRWVPLAFAALGGGAILVSVFLPGALISSGGPERAVAALQFLIPLLIGGVVWGLWAVVQRFVTEAAATVAAEARLVGCGRSGGAVPVERYADLAPLPASINDLAERLAQTHHRVAEIVKADTARIEEQNSRLAAVLHDLHEGVLVCNLQHQVLLYNQMAVSLLQVSGEIGLGRSLFQLVLADPVLHTLERLHLRVREGRHQTHADGTATQFVGGTCNGATLLHGRMSLILHESSELHGDGDAVITGYVVTFTDATQDLNALGQRDALLRAATEDMRAPVANLRAMLETLVESPELSLEERAGFEQAMLSECSALSDRVEQMSERYRGLISGSWPMSDLHSINLLNLVIHRVAAQVECGLTATGLPCWLHGDSFSLVILLQFLIAKLVETTGLRSFDLSATASGRWVYVDVDWAGPPLSSSLLDSWKELPMPAALGGLTVGDVLQHHRSDLWSETSREGYARLRLPLVPAQRQAPAAQAQPRPARPEFFDFSLLVQPVATSELHSRRLDDLTYVVFDCETTGLQPSGGDEIISIAGVRIVNHRILTGECFNVLVNPKRLIPPESTTFHGITDAMVRDQPSAEDILPQFRTFVGESVLVAHNAAFDLKFLRMKEQSCGTRFDNPVLDTMLLSLQLQGAGGDHSLDGIAARLGVSVVDRHNALGDSFTTAAVFLHLLDVLKERGVVTLDDAIRHCNILAELRARERVF